MWKCGWKDQCVPICLPPLHMHKNVFFDLWWCLWFVEFAFLDGCVFLLASESWMSFAVEPPSPQVSRNFGPCKPFACLSTSVWILLNTASGTRALTRFHRMLLARLELSNWMLHCPCISVRHCAAVPLPRGTHLHNITTPVWFPQHETSRPREPTGYRACRWSLRERENKVSSPGQLIGGRVAAKSVNP